MESVLRFEGVTKTYHGGARPALDDVSFDVAPGETVGIVGESGSGKTTLSKIAMRLLDADAGSVRFDGHDISALRGSDRRIRGRIQAVFQDPLDSLNPRFKVRDSIAEPLRAARLPSREIADRVEWAREQVGLDDRMLGAYPRQLSGGQRQRVSIARAIVLRPPLVILDEPTSSLDVIVQARVLNLLLSLQQETGCSYLFISHDIAVVSHLAHRVGVMREGRLVEFGDAHRVLRTPEDEYTRSLIASVPRLEAAREAAWRRRTHQQRGAQAPERTERA